MMHINLYEDLTGRSKTDLLDFICSISNKISICDRFDGYLNPNEFDDVKASLLEEYKEIDLNNRQRFKDNEHGYRDHCMHVFKTEKKAEAYIRKQYKNNLEKHQQFNYDGFKDKKEKGCLIHLTDFIRKKYTIASPVTQGPLQRLQYFKIDKTFNDIKSQLTSLFNYPYVLENVRYEDLTFYKDERLILAICSHENFAYLSLTDDEFNKIITIDSLVNKFN